MAQPMQILCMRDSYYRSGEEEKDYETMRTKIGLGFRIKHEEI